MSRNNKLFLVILTFVISLMIGYALFSETVTISGTATSQGQFKITTTCITGFSNSIEPITDGMPALAGDVKNSKCSVSNNKVTFSTSLGYPGSYQFYTIQFKNTGTMDALFFNDSDIYEKFTGTLKVYNHSNNALYKTVTLPSNDTFAINFSNVLVQAGVIVKTDGTTLLSGEQESGRIVESNGEEYVKIKPNETLEIVIVAIWPDNDNNALKAYYATTTYNQNFDFKQSTINDIPKNNSYFCVGGC